MISLKNKPIPVRHLRLGQTADVFTASAPAAPGKSQDATKPLFVLSGLALTALSAATAYVAISYGMQKNITPVQKALGWTIGVVGVISGLVRLAGTTAVALSGKE